MPTLTRLVSMALFGAMTYFLAMRYQLLFDDPRVSLAGNWFLAIIAALIGWYFVGPRIGRSFLQAFTVVIQGYIATLLLALVLYGLYDVFTQGYARRYKDLNDALNGAVGSAIGHLERMMDPDFLILMLVVAFMITIIVTSVFRLAEARRLDR